MEIGLPVPEKKIFKGFLPYVGMAPILVMGPASCHQIFISLYLKAFINQRTNGPVNAHLISGPSKSPKHTKPEKNKVISYSFTELVVCTGCNSL